MDAEPKPCPFCGGAATTRRWDDRGEARYLTGCPRCGVCFEDPAAWDRRVTAPACAICGECLADREGMEADDEPITHRI